MSSKRKAFIVVTLSKGNRQLWALDEDAAWKAAVARGWKPIEVYEKKELKEAA
jgi:hypothetical protein